MKKNFLAFKIALGKRESGNNYKIVNDFGFLGRFQFGKPRLWDLGYSIDGWKPRWSWKQLQSYKVTTISLQEFLNDSILQDTLFLKHVKDLQRQIRRKYHTGSTVTVYNGIPITESGLVAGAHLKGMGGVKEFLKGNDNSDALGTKISEYIYKFAGYDLDDMS